MNTRSTHNRLRAKVLIPLAGLLTVVSAVAAVSMSSAAYTDAAYARTDSIAADVAAPFQPGLSKNSRMVDTGVGLANDGNVYVWGLTSLNINGGAANPGGQRAPQKVPLPDGQIRQVTGGIYNVNALAADGTVYGWGSDNSRDGTDAAKLNNNPRQIRIGTAWNGSGSILNSIITVSSTETAGAGIRSDATVWNWGSPVGYGGNTASGATQLVGLPDPTVSGNRPVYLKGAYTNFFTILENGDVYYWGGAGGDSLPPGTASQTSATYLSSLGPWMKKNVAAGAPYIVAVDGGVNMGAALLSDGSVLSWGSTSNRTGRTGTTAPAIIPKLAGVVSMQFGYTGVALMKNDGQLWGYGASDDYGQFPELPALIDLNVVQYASGQGYYLWQRQDGTFWGRGYNPQGALGLPIGSQSINRQISWDLSMLKH